MTPAAEGTSQAVVAAEEETAPKAWTSEPTKLDALLDEYIIESKFSGRHPGTTLYLTLSTKRSGEVVNVTDNQKYKLFLDTFLDSHV